MDRVYGYGKQHHRPHHRRSARHYDPLVVAGSGSPAHVEIDHRRRGQRIERGTEVRHGRRQDGRHQQTGDAHRHLLHDESGKDAVAVAAANAGQRRRVHPVEHPQARANQQEQRELHKDHHAARQQCQPALPQVLRRQHPLHHELVCAMARHGQERSAQHARPEGVGRGQVHGEVQHVELARGACDRVDRRPPARHMTAQRPDCGERASNVYGHLDNIGPDHSRHATLKGIQQRERGDDRNRQYVARPNRDAHHNRHGKHAHALRGRPRQQKQPRCDFIELPPKPAVDQLVGGQHLALKVPRQKQQRHYHPPAHVAEDNLQEPEVSRKRQPRRSDDCQRAGLCRHNRQPDGPPRDGLVRQKIPAQRFILCRPAPCKPQPKQRNRNQVQPHHAEIDRMQPYRHA